jgi:hypothetical protein
MGKIMAENVFEQFNNGGTPQQDQPGQPQQEQQSKPVNIFEQFNHPVADNQQATPPKQSGFMDMVDAFNAETRRFVNGELQGVLATSLDKNTLPEPKSLVGLNNAIMGSTAPVQQALAQDTAQYNQLGEQAAQNSPYAAGAGRLIGAVGNIVNTAAQGGTATGIAAKSLGLNTAEAVAPSIAGVTGQGANAAARLGYSASVTGAEQGLEYGTPAERADRAIGGSLGASVGQVGAEGVGLAARTLINKLGGIRKPIQNAITGDINQELPKQNYDQPTNEFFGTNIQTPPSAAQETVPTAMTLGQATGNKKVQALEGFLSGIPLLGTKSNMQNAAETIDSIAGNTLDKLGVNKENTANLGNMVKQEVKNTYKTATNITDKTYDTAFKIGEMEGQTIPNEVVDQSIAKINSLANDENLKSLNIMPQYSVKLPNGQLSPAKNLQDAQQLMTPGAQIVQTEPGNKLGKLLEDLQGKQDISPANFDRLRKTLKNNITTLSTTDKDAASGLIDIKNALDTDLNLTSATGSHFGNALQYARDTFQKYKAPFKDNKVLADIVNPMKNISGTDILARATKFGNEDLTNTIMSNITPTGKEAFTTALIQKAAKSSLDVDGQTLDMNKLLTNIHKIGESTNALPTRSKLALKGLQDVLYRGRDVIEAAKPTKSISGQAYATWGGILGALGGSAAAGSGLGLIAGVAAPFAVKGLSSMLTNPKVVRQLIRLGQGSLTAPAKDATIKYILEKSIIPGIGAANTDKGQYK